MRALKLVCSIIFPAISLASPCERIVTLAPSISETVVALGLGANIIGKVRYDKTKDIAKASDVGGYLDPSVESIVALRPSIVLLLKESEDTGRLLNAVSVKTEIVEHRSVGGILDSIDLIAKRCEIKTDLKQKLSAQLDAVLQRTKTLKPKRTLILIRNDGDDDTHTFFVSGRDGYYDELLKYAGGENVFKRSTTALGNISEESITLLNPEVILHISPPGSDFAPIGNYKQYLISDEYAMIPGPRAGLLAEKMAKTLHPEAWNETVHR